MFPEELSLNEYFDILLITITGTCLFTVLTIVCISIYIWSGKHWLSRIESLIFRGIERLDKYFYGIFDLIFGEY